MRRKKDNKTIQVILGGFIAFIMITSVVGFMFGRGEDQTIKFNKFSFIRKDVGWQTTINKEIVNFNFFPTELADITIDPLALQRIINTPMVYMTYDGSYEGVEFIAQAVFELDSVFNEHLNIYTSNALTATNEFGLPIINCANATLSVPVIEFKATNKTEISLQRNCIVIEAKSDVEFLKAKDKLAYKLLGIIK